MSVMGRASDNLSRLSNESFGLLYCLHRVNSSGWSFHLRRGLVPWRGRQSLTMRFFLTLLNLYKTSRGANPTFQVLLNSFTDNLFIFQLHFFHFAFKHILHHLHLISKHQLHLLHLVQISVRCMILHSLARSTCLRYRYHNFVVLIFILITTVVVAV